MKLKEWLDKLLEAVGLESEPEPEGEGERTSAAVGGGGSAGSLNAGVAGSNLPLTSSLGSIDTSVQREANALSKQKEEEAKNYTIENESWGKEYNAWLTNAINEVGWGPTLDKMWGEYMRYNPPPKNPLEPNHNPYAGFTEPWETRELGAQGLPTGPTLLVARPGIVRGRRLGVGNLPPTHVELSKHRL